MSSGAPRGRTLALIFLIGLLLPLVVAGLASAELTTGPPPTPVPPDGSLSPFPQTLHTPADPSAPPELIARSAMLADLDTGQVLFAKEPDTERPIASLTKIMTALLVLERSDPADIVTVRTDAVIPGEDRGGVSSLGLEVGERISVGDLLYALLLQSANDAAVALADHVSGSEARFVRAMNARAVRLGMRHTRFRSPNGLDDRGFSTARDLSTLTRAAMAIPAFASIVATEFHDIPAPEGGVRSVQNRNALLWLYPDATGVKTGFTSRAGDCVVATATQGDRRLVAVVLGDTGEVFSEAAELLEHGFAAFTRRMFVTEGTPSGVVRLRGGSVPVQTGSDLEALVPTESVDAVQRQVVVDPTAAYPPMPGERVGSLKVTLPGLTVGRVPLVVSSVPPPPPIDDRPWWERAAEAVFDAVRAGVQAVTG